MAREAKDPRAKDRKNFEASFFKVPQNQEEEPKESYLDELYRKLQERRAAEGETEVE